jgi:hypothetical protein
MLTSHLGDNNGPAGGRSVSPHRHEQQEHYKHGLQAGLIASTIEEEN